MTGVNLAIKRETFGAPEDYSWLGSAHGTNEADPITLNGDAFLTTFTDGVVFGGTVVAKNAGTGLYEPYLGSPSETQVLTRTSTGGTVTLTFDGATTAAVAASAAGFTAAAVEAALEALSNVDPADVTVTGSAGGPLTITFGGRYLGQNVPAITVDNTSATGGTIVQSAGVAGGAAGAEAAGHLLTTIDLGGTTAGTVGNTGAALYWHGEVIVAKLKAGNGLDAAARVAMKHVRYVD